MEFMNIVREKAAALAKGAVKTSNVVVETVKSSFAIVDKEAETSKLLRELGSLMYDAYKSGSEVDADAAAEKCAALDGCYNQIESLKEKVDDLKNLKNCPACDAKVKAEFLYCPSCGEKMK